MKKHRILLISSANPLVGPGGMAMDAYKALCEAGFYVDFYTKYPVPGHEDIGSFCPPVKSLWLRYRDTVFLRLHAPGYAFFYGKEEHPPVPIHRVVDMVNGEYDLIIIMFWQDLLSFATVEALFDKFKCPVLLFTVDASIATGGCHYPGKCNKFQSGCGRCPGLKWSFLDHFTRHNVAFRKRFFNKVAPAIMANRYLKEKIFSNSDILRGYAFEMGFPVIDEKRFCPRDKTILRKQFAIPDHKRFLMLAGAQNLSDERKGGIYLKNALSLFFDELSPSDKDSLLLITVGKSGVYSEWPAGLECRDMGFVSISVLSELFALSDVFLCPSVEDAGPMMVNQSLSCGTPVVMFQMGTAFDVVDGKGTGYCARLRDEEDFCRGIRWAFNMDWDQRNVVSARCREVALQTTSYGAFSRFVSHILNQEDNESRKI